MIASAKNDLAALMEFLREVSEKAPQTTPDEAIDAWHQLHAESDAESLTAIRQSLADMEAGERGYPVEDVIAEMRSLARDSA
ncbi:MAG: hypothetical protein K2X38_12575 [Gemmataceae bacterium]|nr:hypothetical protein [Gemmataceae bacterium]